MKKFSDPEIKNLLNKEFRALGKKSRNYNHKSRAVVVLAAEEISVERENKTRIDAGLKIVKRLKNGPTLLYLGTLNHNQRVKKYISSKNIKYDLISSNSQANTKDQIIDFQDYLNKHPMKTIVIISHLYHIPRIRRYCSRYIDNNQVNIAYWGIGKISEQKEQSKEEISKIIEYSKNGDLPLFL